ncbi:MAG: aldo/keto reductase [Planctomycetes bacterium]|nr:aldo/keto reductase [Planctomycetota bacterium]
MQNSPEAVSNPGIDATRSRSSVTRAVGGSDLRVTPVALGCWPIAGITSLDVNDEDSLATIRACFDSGINFLDTAYCYGRDGESERLIARAIGPHRDAFVLASKAGIHWDARGERQFDASPATLRRECDESLQRLQTDRIDLYYLHAPDPKTPIAESAGVFREMRAAGKILAVGVSNVTLEQLREFHEVCPVDALQPPYNMLMREIESDLLPWCLAHRVSVIVYWPLMKGLLVGKLLRDHQFQPGDGRAKYPMFQSPEWEKNQDFLDELSRIARDLGRSVADLVTNWTIHRPGITAALCGAKRAQQIRESAAALTWRLSPAETARIDDAIRRRGRAVVRSAV